MGLKVSPKRYAEVLTPAPNLEIESLPMYLAKMKWSRVGPWRPYRKKRGIERRTQGREAQGEEAV